MRLTNQLRHDTALPYDVYKSAVATAAGEGKVCKIRYGASMLFAFRATWGAEEEGRGVR